MKELRFGLGQGHMASEKQDLCSNPILCFTTCIFSYIRVFINSFTNSRNNWILTICRDLTRLWKYMRKQDRVSVLKELTNWQATKTMAVICDEGTSSFWARIAGQQATAGGDEPPALPISLSPCIWFKFQAGGSGRGADGSRLERI